MARYRRLRFSGATYFFTVVTYKRRFLFVSEEVVRRLRVAFRAVMDRHPFAIEAMVVLPDHLHTIWRLPENDADYSTRWRLIKYRFSLGWSGPRSDHLPPSLCRRREKGIWQRRFWEHTIRDESDYRRHVDYIHYNPVKHGLVARPADWTWTSFGRFVQRGVYDRDWGAGELPGSIRGLDRE